MQRGHWGSSGHQGRHSRVQSQARGYDSHSLKTISTYLRLFQELQILKHWIFSGWLCARGGEDEQREDRVGGVQCGAALLRPGPAQTRDNLDQEEAGVSDNILNLLCVSFMKCRCLAFRLHSVNCYQLIYLLIASLHCDCNQGKTGREVYFWINPIYCNFNTLLILKFLWFSSSDFKNLVFVNSLVLYFNTKTKFSLFRETLMKYPSSLKVSAPWWCDISPDFREELAEVLPSDKYRISNSEPEPFELGADIYTTNSVLRRPELYCHTVMTR